MDPSTAGSETNIFYIALIGVASFLFIALSFIIFYIFSQRRDQDKQEKLYQQRLDFQQRLLKASIEGQEEERARLAKELHDGVNGNLAAIKLQVAGATDAAALARVAEALSEVSSEVRAISHDLLPPAFAQRGLVAASQGVCDRLTDEGEITVFLHCNDPRRRFEAQRELNVFRIVQELFSNSLKHAAAQRIELSLDFAPQQLTLSYADDGRGFAYTPSAEHNKEALASLGLGMSNLQARTDLLGGALRIDTAPGAGFRAELTLEIDSLQTPADAKD